AENERLARPAGRAAAPTLEDHRAELASLRAQAELLRRQTNEMGRKLEQTSRQHESPDDPEKRSPEYQHQLQLAAGARDYDTYKLATAILLYAFQHQEQTPTNFDCLGPDLDRVTKAAGQRPISGTDQFDFVFHGSRTNLHGIPASEVAVLRHREIWTTPD